MKIKTNIQGVDFSASQWESMLKALLDERGVTALLHKQNLDETILHASLSGRKKGGAGMVVKLHTHLPGKKIVAANGEGKDVRGASEKAVAHLFREMKKHLDHLRGLDQVKRKARRERLRALKEQIAALPTTTQDEARHGLEGLLERLEQVARRELAYLRAVGELPSDYPTVRDVVDEAIAASEAAWQSGRPEQEVLRDALKHLFRVIDQEVRSSRLFGEAVPLDAPAPEDAKDQAEAMVEEEFYEYYQPDDTLSVADVIPAEEPDGLPDAEQETQQAWTVDVIKDLPMAWRRALLLHELEQISPQDIAVIFETTEAAVNRWIEQALGFVHARMIDVGLDDGSGDPRTCVLRVLLAQGPR